MNSVPYLAPHMGPWLILMCIMALGVGLWIRTISPREIDSFTPDIYTAENIRCGDLYHVGQDEDIQEFEVLATHWSGYFQIRVMPPKGHELNRDFPVVLGWAKELPSNRLIEARHLLIELPIELRLAPSYN